MTPSRRGRIVLTCRILVAAACRSACAGATRPPRQAHTRSHPRSRRRRRPDQTTTAAQPVRTGRLAGTGHRPRDVRLPAARQHGVPAARGGPNAFRWDAFGWRGGDVHRFWFKSEGRIADRDQ